MARPHKYLRGLIIQNGDTNAEAAHAICLGATAFSQKINCKREWTVTEMYALMDRYKQPYSDLHIVFPKMGRNE